MAALAMATGMTRADSPLWSHIGSSLIECCDGRRRRSALASGFVQRHSATEGRWPGTAQFLRATDSDYVIGRVRRADGGMVLV
jgi:hypothetical protein